jgi:hypothetical protein
MHVSFVFSFHGDRDKLHESFLFVLVMVQLDLLSFPPCVLPMATSKSLACAILVDKVQMHYPLLEMHGKHI